MTASSWLDELPTLGRLPAAEAAVKLREVDEDELAAALQAARYEAPSDTYSLLNLGLRRDRVFRYTGHAIGHLAPVGDRHTNMLEIRHVGAIAPDPSLKGERITITLDSLHIADYPGRGPHLVLFDFAADNVHFNATYRATDGGHAAVVGRPIFVGLPISDQGLHLQAATVNVHNQNDEVFLRFLETDVFTAGLQLAGMWQPVLEPFSAMAVALTKAIATRHRNVVVQTVELGLDFRHIATGARLAEGAYIAVQIPESAQTVWRWQDWIYDPVNGSIVNAANHSQPLPYNSFTIGINRYQGE